MPPKPLSAKCVICFDVFPRDKLNADHKHEKYWKTLKPPSAKPHYKPQILYKGPFRGWLCRTCNIRIGWFECESDLKRRCQDYVDDKYFDSEDMTLDELYKRACALREHQP